MKVARKNEVFFPQKKLSIEVDKICVGSFSGGLEAG
jgi:hypothetical protein